MTHPKTDAGIKAILFDKDGTLFDFYATWGEWVKTILQENSHQDPQRAIAMGQAIGYDVQSGQFAPDSMVIADTPADIAAALLRFFPDHSHNSLIDYLNERSAQTPQIQAVPLKPLLRGLRDQGLQLGIATNDAQAPALAHLQTAGIVELFDFVAGCDSGHGCKPAPGMQMAFAEKTNLPPAQIAMVGDSTHDLIAGRAAGMTTVAVLTGVAKQPDLSPYADVVLPDIGHLPPWIASLR